MCRYGHGSCLLSDGSIIVVGGFGIALGNGHLPQSRLNNVVRLTPVCTQWELRNLENEGTCPGEIINIYRVVKVHWHTHKYSWLDVPVALLQTMQRKLSSFGLDPRLFSIYFGVQHELPSKLVLIVKYVLEASSMFYPL